MPRWLNNCICGLKNDKSRLPDSGTSMFPIYKINMSAQILQFLFFAMMMMNFDFLEPKQSYQNATNVRSSWFASFSHITIGVNMNGMFAGWQTSCINIHQHRIYWAYLSETHFTMFAITFASPQHWPCFPVWFRCLVCRTWMLNFHRWKMWKVIMAKNNTLSSPPPCRRKINYFETHKISIQTYRWPINIISIMTNKLCIQRVAIWTIFTWNYFNIFIEQFLTDYKRNHPIIYEQHNDFI